MTKINISCILLNTFSFVLCNFGSESVENIFFHASSVPFGRDTQPKKFEISIFTYSDWKCINMASGENKRPTKMAEEYT